MVPNINNIRVWEMNYGEKEMATSKVKRRLSIERKTSKPPQLKPLGMQPIPLAVGSGLVPSPKNTQPEIGSLKMESYQPQQLDLSKLGKKALTPTEKSSVFVAFPPYHPGTPPPTGQDKFFKAPGPGPKRQEREPKLTQPPRNTFSKMMVEYFPNPKDPFTPGFPLSTESPTEKQRNQLLQQRTDRVAKVSDYFSEEYCQPMPKELKYQRQEKVFQLVPPQQLMFKKTGPNISPTHLQTCSTFQTIRHKKSEESLQHASLLQKRESRSLRLDDFVLIKEMGVGTFGRVIMVMHRQTRFLAALKVIPKKMIMENQLLNRFVNELKIQAYLNHPNIVQLYGYFHDHQNVYVLLELGSEGQLYTKLRQKQRYSEYGALFIIRDLLSSVHYMHSKKLLHRDIKPENIVVVHGTVKLCDFGWSVYRGNDLRSTFCGTPLYISPEQISGKSYDQKVDLWAIGILSYELVVGRIPFEITDKAELKKIVTDDILFPTDLELSDTYKDFVLRILSKNPKHRLQASELLKHPYIAQSMSDDTNDELCAS